MILKKKLGKVARQEKQIVELKKEFGGQIEAFELRAQEIEEQNAQIENQTEKINQQKVELGEQSSALDSQKKIVYLLVALFSLMFIVALLVYRTLRSRKKANLVLRAKNLAIERQASQLEQANIELGQFAYVASHDLQEPLRTVANFVEVLQEDYASHLDEEAHRYFGLITDSTLRMKTLVKDLLDYSRIGREREFEPVDCNILLHEIKDDLSSLISEKDAQLKLEHLPTIPGSKTDLRLLFQNLINNGIKFGKPGQAPKIRLSAKRIEDNWQFMVEDDGIGISEDYHEKIFIIFQRLHNKREYEGTGIGLAHCKKIVDLHSGSIWVESSLGKGSTFFVSLPGNST